MNRAGPRVHVRTCYRRYRTTLRKNKKGTVLVPLEKEDNRSATMRNVRNKIAQRSRAQSKVVGNYSTTES